MTSIQWKLTALLALLCILPRSGWATEVKGFVQTQLQAGEGTDRTVDDFGLVVTHTRFKLIAKPADSVTVVVMPEVAGKFALLDAFADWKLDEDGLYVLRMGQFKFPFGLNRMYTPSQLARTGYSKLNGSVFPGHAWDVGAQLGLNLGALKAQLAVIEGQGPNLGSTGPVGTRKRSDFSGRAEYSMLDGSLVLGASIYQGLSHKTPWIPVTPGSALGANHTWGGGHLKAAWGPLGLEAEVINRDDLLWGATAEPSLKLMDGLRVLVYYDRVENQANDSLSTTAMGAALVFEPVEKLEFTLDVRGGSTGPEQKPQNTAAVLQAQAAF